MLTLKLKNGIRNDTYKMSNEIEPYELKEKIDKKKDIILLDVRTPEEYETWKISYGGHEKPILAPLPQLLTPGSQILANIPKDKEIVTICSHGNRSGMAANMLSTLGYNVKSLKGGMVNWNAVQDIAPVPVKTESVRIWQVRRIGKGCMGYLIASMNDKTAIVIDPVCEGGETYMQIARENGLRITKVIDTHMHADHVSGLARLCKLTGADPCLSSIDGYEANPKGLSEFKQIRDGDHIGVGDGIAITAINTPGHTKGSMCFSLNSQGDNYLFTGDILFVDGIGRPDLRDKAKEFASDLYDTLQKITKDFPDNTVILPCHYSSSIVLQHGKLVSGTLGAIKSQIKLVSLSKEEFINNILGSIPPRPMNYRVIIDINKKMISCDEIDIRDIEAGPNSCAVPT